MDEDLVTAESLLTRARETFVRTKTGSWQLADTQSAWGAYLTTLARYAEAEPILIESHAALARARGARAIYTRNALRRIAELYEAWGKPEQSALYRRMLRQTEVPPPRPG